MVSTHAGRRVLVTLLIAVLLVPGVAADDGPGDANPCIIVLPPYVSPHDCIDEIADLLHWVVYTVEELIP